MLIKLIFLSSTPHEKPYYYPCISPLSHTGSSFIYPKTDPFKYRVHQQQT
jgi:hypothetical protein